MGVRLKLVAIILFAGLLPLAVLTFTSLSTQQRASQRRVDELQRAKLHVARLRVQAYLDSQGRQLELLGLDTIQWRELTGKERNGAAWLVYRQFEDAIAVWLTDAEGRNVIPDVYTTDAGPADLRDKRLQPTTELIAALHGDSEAPPKLGVVRYGSPVGNEEGPFVGATMGVAGTDDRPWTLGVGLSLRGLCDELAPAETEVGSQVLLTNGKQRVICPASGAEPVALDEAVSAAVARTESSGRVTAQGGDGQLLHHATLPNGWRLITLEPAARALAVGRALQRRAYLWIGVAVLIALAAGLYLGRGLIRPIDRLTEGARELTRGNFEHRIDYQEQDEFGRLAEAFDRMSEEVERRDAEIRDWNSELQDRVEERTSELERAYGELIRSQRFAALGNIGAGLAHEMNGPLTSVLGVTQLLRKRLDRKAGLASEAKLLQQAESEAQSMRVLLKRLLSTSQRISRRHLTDVAIHELLDAALHMIEQAGEAEGVDFVRRFDDTSLMARCSFMPIQQAVVEIVKRAISAMPAGGTVTLRTGLEDELIHIAIEDDGPAIPDDLLDVALEPFSPIGDGSEALPPSLGLAIARRIIEEHGGTIELQSGPDSGTTVTFTLPTVASKPPSSPQRDADEASEASA